MGLEIKIWRLKGQDANYLEAKSKNNNNNSNEKTQRNNNKKTDWHSAIFPLKGSHIV